MNILLAEWYLDTFFIEKHHKYRPVRGFSEKPGLISAAQKKSLKSTELSLRLCSKHRWRRLGHDIIMVVQQI
jgi:hypothetical protein